MKLIDGFWFPDDEQHFADKTKNSRRLKDYQSEQRSYAKLQVSDWSLALDLGANVGIFSRHFARYFKHVLAIEPMPSNVECLRRNVPSNVAVKAVAVGDRQGKIKMVWGRKSGSRSYVFNHRDVVKASNAADDSRLVDVPLITVDSLNLRSCGLVKIDLMGSELIALKGAAGTIKRCRPVVIVAEKEEATGSRHIADSRTLLLSLGMTPMERIGADRIYVFDEPHGEADDDN